MVGKPSLLLALAGTAALLIAAHAAAVAEGPPPPTRMGVSIKQSVEERDKAAARRNRALDLREQAARAAEARLKADMEASEPPAGRTNAKAEPQEDQFDALARIYQAMKPVKAAKVFEQLELEVQMKVAQKMRDRSTAMILAAMTPEAAARLSMALARRGAAAAPAAGSPAGPKSASAVRKPGPETATR